MPLVFVLLPLPFTHSCLPLPKYLELEGDTQAIVMDTFNDGSQRLEQVEEAPAPAAECMVLNDSFFAPAKKLVCTCMHF